MSNTADQLEEIRAGIERVRQQAMAMMEGRKASDLKPEEIAHLEELHEERARLEDEHSAMMTYQKVSGEAPEPGQRRTAPAGRETAEMPSTPALMARRDPTMSFANMGDFASTVKQCSTPGTRMDERLARMAASTWSGETAATDGGYLLPPEFSNRIMEYVGEQSSLYTRCTKTPVNVALSWPQDEETPWSSSGPQVYWAGEGDARTESKVRLSPGGNRLGKLVCLCPVTDELLEDTGQLASYLERTIAKRIRWKVDDGIINGTGAGQGMLGILKAKSLKTVAKETSQTADTINDQNVLKIWNAMYGDFRSSATWIYNQDAELQLLQMMIAGTSSDVPVFLPSGPMHSSFAGPPQSTMFGRPAIAHQACQTLGDKGDILFCDLSQYLIGQKTMGPVSATSMHFYFDQDLQAIKVTWRICGQPLWSKTITANNGTATYSPFVTLAARA